MSSRHLTIALAALTITSSAFGQSNIDSVKKFAWTENCGWTNWRDANSTNQGVVVGTAHLQGFVWGENVGWINTGNGGAPYANTNHTNFGVNIGVGGFLNGYAWGENIGWINFNTQPQIGAQGARYDSAAGRFRGYAWGENIGWINLDDSTHYVARVPTCCLGNADKVSGQVTFGDITSVLANFNGPANLDGSSVGDADCNGVINFADITAVLANFLSNCP
ncbi:MAG: hypothetical protein JNK58_06625 [Phycisphaerae bacterium]|nr:hypothetical protein [Phycisphaerae bacterium]